MTFFITFAQTFLIMALLAITVFSLTTRLSLLSVLGMNMFAVSSGSMQPTIPVGSLVYVTKSAVDHLMEGDIITYKKKDTQGNITITTHRITHVHKVQKGEEGKVVYTFNTKGDANNVDDAYQVHDSEIIGIYKWNIPKLGYIALFIQKPLGFLVGIILPATTLLVWEIISVILHYKNYYRQESVAQLAVAQKIAQKELSKKS